MRVCGGGCADWVVICIPCALGPTTSGGFVSERRASGSSSGRCRRLRSCGSPRSSSFPASFRPCRPRRRPPRWLPSTADHTARVQYSMILFNWFCVALIPILMLIVERMRGMAHRTPVLRYCVIGVAGAAPIAFLTATVFWLIAAFRPDRAPEITQMCNDLAWITFTCGVPFLVALCLFLAVAISFDVQDRPVFPRWVATLQRRDRDRAHTRLLRRVHAQRAVRLERLPVVLGQERRHRALDRRHGDRAGTSAVHWSRERSGPRREASRLARRPEARAVVRVVRDRRVLQPLQHRLLRHHAHPAPRQAVARTRSGRGLVRRSSHRLARRVRAHLRARWVLGDVTRVDHLLDSQDVRQPRVRVLVPDPLRRWPRFPGSCSSASR